MQIGAVLPHNEIGTDPGAIKAYLQGVEDLGFTHLLVYDHVLGAAPDRPGGFKGAYDTRRRLPRAVHVLRASRAAVTSTLELVSTVLILPQRQTVLVAKQAAEVAVLSNNRVRLGVGTGWNKIEYAGPQRDVRQPRPPPGRAGRADAPAVEPTTSSTSTASSTRSIGPASIRGRRSRSRSGSAARRRLLLERCARLGDGWMPLGGANDKSAALLAEIRGHREAAGLSMDGFGVQAQAQYAGGTPERWRGHAEKWKDIGATHMALATHNAGPTDVDGHLSRIVEYQAAVAGL